MRELDEILENVKKPISIDTIIDLMKITDVRDQCTIYEELEKRVDEYSLIRTEDKKYLPIFKTSFRKGKFYSNKDGSGKVIVKSDFINKKGERINSSTIYDIDSEHVNGAIDGDVVLINLYSKYKNSNTLGSVKKVINRNLDFIVGEVFKVGNDSYVRPVNKKYKSLTIKLDSYEPNGINVGVRLNNLINNEYTGNVIRRFNNIFDPSEELLIEAFKCGVINDFSKESMNEVKNIPMFVRDVDKIGREDLTDLEIFTIDGNDTKDIDDAVSCKKLDNGNYLVGVHIADVSNYVSFNSNLDNDAFMKGTSVYLPGSVIPMLPKELSNGICSLNPGVERLAISCFMEINGKGDIVNHDIKKSVIKSNLKMTYDEVNNVLHERKNSPEYDCFKDSLRNLNKVALILKKKRLLNGAISFNKDEIKVVVDDNKNVVGFEKRKEDLAENLIEELMVAANETVDKHLVEKGYSCVHRIHDYPSDSKMEDFFRLLSAVGLQFDKYTYYECCDNPKFLKELQEHIKNNDSLSKVLNNSLIRCMSKAKYSTTNIGHYGLAKSNYCHFTSPIRRYPDLVVHRLIKLCLDDKKNINIENSLDEISLRSSKMERVAIDAENECNKLMFSKYMENHIGEEFLGVINAIDDCGMNVVLDNLIEGRVRAKDLSGRYNYNSDNFCLESADNKDNYKIGDNVLLKVIRAKKENKVLDFSIVKKINEKYKVLELKK